jgi:hypothetical protein
MLAIDILKWPGMNQAFLFSFFITSGLALVTIPYGKRRPVGTPTSWGEAILGATYTFFVMFLAFGVVPHQLIDHIDKNLGWRKDKLLFGPGSILKPKHLGGNFPMDVSYEALRDIVIVGLHVYFVALMIFVMVAWQKRGEKAVKAIETSTYGRPLVRKN